MHIATFSKIMRHHTTMTTIHVILHTIPRPNFRTLFTVLRPVVIDAHFRLSARSYFEEHAVFEKKLLDDGFAIFTSRDDPDQSKTVDFYRRQLARETKEIRGEYNVTF